VNSHADRTVVQAIIAMAHGLGLRTVVEGIEEQATWDVIASLGCQLAQGFLVSRPQDFDSLTPWLLARASAPVPAIASGFRAPQARE
jgi:EAL domain-containing protein (putative c-di-GMP-specific phosphodiesterase class I)